MDGKQRCPKQNIDHYQFAVQLKTEAGLQDVTWMCRSFALGVLQYASHCHSLVVFSV